MSNLKQEIIETLTTLLLDGCYKEGKYNLERFNERSQKIIDMLKDDDTIILSKKKIENDIITTRPIIDYRFDPDVNIRCTSHLDLKVVCMFGNKKDIDNLATTAKLGRKIYKIYGKMEKKAFLKNVIQQC